jgi:glutathione S-transferase
VLAESTAIVEYLDEVFAPPAYVRLLPADLRQRARARQVLSWLRSDVAAVREERSTTTMFYARARRPLSDAARAASEKLVGVAGSLITTETGPLFGNSWCSADSDLAFALHRLILNDDPVPPKVRAWAQHQWQRPSVQAFVTHIRPQSPG